MLNDLWVYVRGLPWKDWASSIIVGGLTLLGVIYAAQERNKLAREQRQSEIEDKRRSAEQAQDIAQTENLTARFQALMDGYEGRINDLSTALRDTQTRLHVIETDLEAHRNICRACPNYPALRGQHA